MRTIQELADTTTSNNTSLLAKRWLDKIVDAGRKKMFFLDVFSQYDVPAGTKDIVIPYKKGYFSTLGTSVTDTTTEGNAVSFTTMDNLTGLTLTPSPHAYGIAISNDAVRKTAVNLVQSAREELSDYWADVVDQAIAGAINGAPVATSSAKGASILYGGDAYSTSTLASGDILVPSLLVKAKTRLQGTKMYYWNGSSEALSSEAKSPWASEPGSPFVAFLGPEQEYVMLTDSQFTNAAEYGDNEVVLNGEIGRYQGIKIVTSVNTTSATNWGGGSLAGHNCYMVKAGVAGAIAWGQRPRLRIFEYPSELETRIILEQSFAADTLHNDSICHIKVADA